MPGIVGHIRRDGGPTPLEGARSVLCHLPTLEAREFPVADGVSLGEV